MRPETSPDSSTEPIPITKRSFPRVRYKPEEVDAIVDRYGCPPPKRVDFQCRTETYEPGFYKLPPGHFLTVKRGTFNAVMQNAHLFRSLVFEVVDGEPLEMPNGIH